jgi:hypothetical protein
VSKYEVAFGWQDSPIFGLDTLGIESSHREILALTRFIRSRI